MLFHFFTFFIFSCYPFLFLKSPEFVAGYINIIPPDYLSDGSPCGLCGNGKNDIAGQVLKSESRLPGCCRSMSKIKRMLSQ